MQLEETQIALAKVVVFLRQFPCPYHEHVTIAFLTPEGMATHRGPICEVAPELVEECEFVEERTELLNECFMTLGTRDMSNFL